MSLYLKRYRVLLIVIFVLACMLAFLPISAFAETGEHTGDDLDDDPSTVVVTQKGETNEQGFGAFISDFLDSFNPFKEANIEDGYYRIKSAVDNNFVVDAAAAGFARGTNIQLYQNNNSDAQLWKIINQDDGYILIVNANSGLVLDITCGLAQNGTNIQSYFTNHTDAQLWNPVDTGDGKVVLVSKLNSNFVLDLSCGTAQNEQNIQLYECNNSNAQRWVFKKVESPALEIPALQLSLNGTTLDTINGGSKDTKYENNTLVVEEEDQTTTCEKVTIKGRGQSTWECFSKKPYNIKLSSKVNLFNLGKAKNWCLLAEAADPSLLRNNVSFHIANMLGMESESGGQYVNLYVDNEYVGIYFLTHKIEINDAVCPCEDDGIVIKMDGWPPDDIYFKSAYLKKQMILKDIKLEDVYAQELLDRFETKWNQFEKFLFLNDYDSYSQITDINSFVQYCLLSEINQNPESFGNSTFFYQKAANGSLYAGPPWDYDRSFGNWSTNISIYDDPQRVYVYKLGAKTVDSLLMQNIKFREAFENLYKNKIMGNHQDIINYVQNEYKNTKNSLKKNNNKWNSTSLESSVSELTNYISKRLDYLDVVYGSRETVSDGFYNIINGNKNIGKYKFELQNDGFYRIINCNDGGSLTVENNLLDNDTPVIDSTWNASDSQKWLICNKNGKYVFIAKTTGLVFDCFQTNHIYDLIPSSTQLFSMQQTTFDTFDVADGTVYDIVSSLNENLDISSNSNNVQTGIGQSVSSSTFKFIKNTDNTYTLQDVASGLVVDVESNSHSNGAKIQLYKSNGSNAQKWILRKNSDGTCTFINPESWKTLDICCGQNAVGTNIQLYEINNTAAQKWAFKTSVKQSVLDLASANKGTVTAGTYKMSSAINAGFVLDVAAGSKDDGANVQLYENNNTAAQEWKISEDSDGFLTIVNVGSGKALDVSGANVADGTNVWQYSGNNSYAQKWIAVKDGSAIKLVSALNPNKVLDLSASAVANGSNIQLYSSNNTKAQRWVFETIS